MASIRNESLLAITDYHQRNIEIPKRSDGKPYYTSEYFGQNVFTIKDMERTLPKSIFQKFIQQQKGRVSLDRATADAIAHSARVWAMDKGATHFTHWFQPQTDSTAEKHDAFLSLKTSITNGHETITAIDTFSGSQLLQAEPDASSFPNGGMRSTFEARGYTVWDTTSPLFIQQAPHGTAVLYIPCVFISYNGEALDEKTALLRSNEAISHAAVRLLHLIGNTDTKRVITTLGVEQEFFLVDRGLCTLRPDLKICGRTLVGSVPPKHQQLEDHYFGKMPTRVLACISETEIELFKLGVPMKTRHNEVAPGQFEMAPIFEESSIAVDHNLLTMEVLHRVAHRHKLKVLFHEKPFKGVNGSGKHCNWSLSTDTGENILDPSVKPETNPRFLLFFIATIYAVYRHGALLRAAIASSSNEHRLGANEAPPGIISVFLGDQLNEVLDAVEEEREIKNFSQHQIQSVKVGGTILDLKIATLPPISRDLTDRNRTSPFAFTGNKFEFRAVGSKQSPAFPVTLINAAVCAALNEIAGELEKIKGDKTFASLDDVLTVVRMFIKKSKPIRFEGDNYSQEWVEEAARRGIPNITSCPEAFKMLLDPVHQKILTETVPIFTVPELQSRYHILNEKYVKDLLIEANTLKGLVSQYIIPSAFEYRKEIAESLVSFNSLGMDVSAAPEKNVLDKVGSLTTKISQLTGDLEKSVQDVSNTADIVLASEKANREILKTMDEIRTNVDMLEQIVADKYWSLPKYSELLF
ncbi:glutamine synthetase/guanido kinase [Neocallimastix californiae]|uniref:Glutamine synthetase/guanido kinase n=1 Tax=Neocallimastix californiae TaxID=1754190 RepID=A0A1Y2D3W1_9FUNG|nr:glutamine synthetase/guanido kinase [Neocallimastix californiae]|eukprot:ORY53971.1 glutamine synthetase/guanido kinase [Neocallimastix californiae]